MLGQGFATGNPLLDALLKPGAPQPSIWLPSMLSI
jgi:hypothetical protein